MSPLLRGKGLLLLNKQEKKTGPGASSCTPGMGDGGVEGLSLSLHLSQPLSTAISLPSNHRLRLLLPPRAKVIWSPEESGIIACLCFLHSRSCHWGTPPPEHPGPLARGERQRTSSPEESPPPPPRQPDPWREGREGERFLGHTIPNSFGSFEGHFFPLPRKNLIRLP